MERLDGGAAGGLGGASRVAIIIVDPIEERFSGCGRDGARQRGRHGQPLVPTARRYSVTCTVPVTPVSTASAFRIAG